MPLNRPIFFFIAGIFFSGLGGAFLFPLTTLYLVEALGATPFRLSLYLVCSVLSAIVVSQWLARYSDQGMSRKRLITIAALCYVATALIFAFNREYWVALAVVVSVTSVSSVAFPQVFALGREYADQHLAGKGTLFLNTMRATIALAWVCGPPLAFLSQSTYGFTMTFLVTAVCGTVSMLIFLNLPDMKDECAAEGAHADTESIEASVPWYRQSKVMVFMAAVVLMFFASNLYILSMPLYLTKELGRDSGLAGQMMGLAALIEIPIMLGVGIVVARLGAHRLLNIGVMFGCLFYIGMTQVTSEGALLALQVFNGLFIGTTATLGMVVMQDMMRDQVGTATTLFSNGLQISMLLASVTIGVLAGYFSYYSAFWVSLSAAGCALLLRLMQDQLYTMRRKVTVSVQP
ncbi:hypothetical protein ABT56_14280 [Photobacterium aquae]|uniref:Major facilitator superfamily (MFS) profile domain-containing protein n=1 Tax=Photobacterium aquae TaxID=1195763 RepID=A0A0J1GYX6_9GAMM|nr:sugar efflux transporter [Photobacterium aquae]KLV04674.1 hypothetical protein ABT56_14280 [Photobacterium aquae]